MKFHYEEIKKGGTYLWLPKVPITVHGLDSKLRTKALIDSGSDVTIFGTTIARKLNIPLRDEIPVELSGLGGGIIKGRKNGC